METVHKSHSQGHKWSNWRLEQKLRNHVRSSQECNGARKLTLKDRRDTEGSFMSDLLAITFTEIYSKKNLDKYIFSFSVFNR